MRRRTLLVGASAALAPTAGCLGSGDRGSPEYDCSQAWRPESERPDSSDAVAPASYPGPPADPGSDDELLAFVTGFEEAYRQNRLVRRYGDRLVSFGFSTEDTWTGSAPAGAGVAGVQYHFYYQTRSDTDGSIVADSPIHTAVYYVDGSVALRVHEEGRRQSGEDPDPREDGDEVACFA